MIPVTLGGSIQSPPPPTPPPPTRLHKLLHKFAATIRAAAGAPARCPRLAVTLPQGQSSTIQRPVAILPWGGRRPAVAAAAARPANAGGRSPARGAARARRGAQDFLDNVYHEARSTTYTALARSVASLVCAGGGGVSVWAAAAAAAAGAAAGRGLRRDVRGN